ncbi:MAG TPA: MerR family DNA-binding protein [Thermoleophilaceae bacterium]
MCRAARCPTSRYSSRRWRLSSCCYIRRVSVGSVWPACAIIRRTDLHICPPSGRWDHYERIELLPKPERVGGQRRYTTDVLGKLGFIGVAQSAGFRLAEIRALIEGVDSSSGMGEQMRVLSTKKLDEVEALLERTKAMKGWLEVAQQCGCATPAECALFDAPEEALADPDLTLRLVQVGGKDCRRPA